MPSRKFLLLDLSSVALCTAAAAGAPWRARDCTTRCVQAIHTRVALAGASGYSSLGQEIVSAASSDSSPNEFTHRRRLRKNNARIDVGRIGFGARDVGLIDQ